MNDVLTGLIAAPHTPMYADGSIRLDVIEQQAEQLVRNGVTGAFLCGSTGEGLSLSVAERKEVARRWIEVAGGSLKIIVHVGHHSLPEACTLAEHAAALGADAISAVAPNVFKPAAVEDLIAFFQPIVAASKGLAFYYYHSPGMTGVNLPVAEFLDLAADAIPNLAGVKFNDGDLMTYQQCLMLHDGSFDVPFGVDEALLGALAVGARGAVGSTYNYAAPIFQRIIRAFTAGDIGAARAASQQTVAIVRLLIDYGPMAAGKAAMSLHGIDCGPPRLPLRPLSPQRRREYLDRLGSLLDLAPPSTGDGVSRHKLAVNHVLASKGTL